MRTILNLNHRQARKFFFKPQSYLSLDLPSYYDFGRIISRTREQINRQTILEHHYRTLHHPRTLSQINYPLVRNKDGQYAWRKHQLVHPFFYAYLVYQLTDRETWRYITYRFRQLRSARIHCASLPPSPTNKLNRNEQDIFNWSCNFTNETVRRALNYKYMLTTDLTHCYDSLPFSLLVRALHDDAPYDPSLIGWRISQTLQDMLQGSTCGIPQGSALMDVLAELALSYIYALVASRTSGLTELYILRYRDDYRIFANELSVAQTAMKILVETLTEFDLKINLSKTRLTSDVIQHAFKPDRLAWKSVESLIFCEDKPSTLKSLLLIHAFSLQYPNCGSIRSALSRLYQEEIYNSGCHDDIWQIASVVTDIMYQSPGTWPYGIAILSKYIEAQGLSYAPKIADRLQRKFAHVPNTEYLDVWLQRLTIKADPFRPYRGRLCQIVYRPRTPLWNSDWLTSAATKIRDQDLIDYAKLFALPTALPPDEVALFANIQGSGE